MVKVPTSTPEVSPDGIVTSTNAAGRNGAGQPLPAPRKERPTKKRSLWVPKGLLRWLGLAAVLIAILAYWVRARGSGGEKPEVKTAVVERGDVRSTVSASGTLQPFTTVDVKSKAGGNVMKMAVDEGTHVKVGQLICLIDRTDTTAAYEQAMADVRTATGALRQAQENTRFQNTTLGPQIRNAGAAVASARAKLDNARQALTLQAETAGPQVREAGDAVDTAQAKLVQARDALTLQQQTAETSINEAQAGVRAAQAKLEQAQQSATTQPELTNAAIAQAQAGVEAAQSNVQAEQQALGLLQTATQPQEVAAAQAQVNEAKSNVDTAQTNLTRLQNLLNKGFVPASQVDTARNQLVVAQSGASTAQAKLDTIKAEQSAQVQAQQARVAQAQGSLRQSQAALNTARANTVQNRLRNQDVLAAQAAVHQTQATLGTAVANRRQIALKRSDVNAAIAGLKQSQSGLTVARANTRNVGLKKSDVDAAIAAVNQSDASLQTTQANVISNQAKGEDIVQSQAKLQRAQITAQNAKTNLAQTTVVAPSAGVILKKYVDVGTIIQSGLSGFSAGSPIVQLADTSKMFVDTQVDEADIAAIEPGQKVAITLDAYPNSPKEGKVTKIYPQAEVVQNVTYIHVQVQVDPVDVDERLRAGMNATCEFEVDSKSNVLEVPSEAVKDDGDVTTVTVIKDPKRPLWDTKNQDKRTVEVGIRGDEATEVTKGLKEGETVVTQIIEPLVVTPGSSSGPPRGPTGGGRGGGGGGMRRGG